MDRRTLQMGWTGAACYRFPSAWSHRCRRCDIHIPARETIDGLLPAPSLWKGWEIVAAHTALINWLIAWPPVRTIFINGWRRGEVFAEELQGLRLDVEQKLDISPAPWLESWLHMAWRAGTLPQASQQETVVELSLHPEVIFDPVRHMANVPELGREPRKGWRDRELIVGRDVEALCRHCLNGEKVSDILRSVSPGAHDPLNQNSMVYRSMKNARALLRLPAPIYKEA